MEKERETEFKNLILTESEIEVVMGALDYWKESYPEAKTIMEKLETAGGFKWGFYLELVC